MLLSTTAILKEQKALQTANNNNYTWGKSYKQFYERSLQIFEIR